MYDRLNVFRSEDGLPRVPSCSLLGCFFFFFFLSFFFFFFFFFFLFFFFFFFFCVCGGGGGGRGHINFSILTVIRELPYHILKSITIKIYQKRIKTILYSFLRVCSHLIPIFYLGLNLNYIPSFRKGPISADFHTGKTLITK